MANLDMYLEAERRGILPPDKAALLNEARSRGLVPGAPGMPQDQMPEPRMTTGQQVLQFVRPTIEALRHRRRRRPWRSTWPRRYCWGRRVRLRHDARRLAFG
jgi:hypothetical protein